MIIQSKGYNQPKALLFISRGGTRLPARRSVCGASTATIVVGATIIVRVVVRAIVVGIVIAAATAGVGASGGVVVVALAVGSGGHDC